MLGMQKAIVNAALGMNGNACCSSGTCATGAHNGGNALPSLPSTTPPAIADKMDMMR